MFSQASPDLLGARRPGPIVLGRLGALPLARLPFHRTRGSLHRPAAPGGSWSFPGPCGWGCAAGSAPGGVPAGCLRGGGVLAHGRSQAAAPAGAHEARQVPPPRPAPGSREPPRGGRAGAGTAATLVPLPTWRLLIARFEVRGKDVKKRALEVLSPRFSGGGSAPPFRSLYLTPSSHTPGPNACRGPQDPGRLNPLCPSAYPTG